MALGVRLHHKECAAAYPAAGSMPPPHTPLPFVLLLSAPLTSPVGMRSSGLAASAPTPHSLRSSSSSSSSADAPDAAAAAAAASLSLSESSCELLPAGPSSSDSSSELLLTSAVHGRRGSWVGRCVGVLHEEFQCWRLRQGLTV
jgi:hypothetical protein